MRAARSRGRWAAMLLAAILATRLTGGLAEAREVRFPTAGDLRLAPEAFDDDSASGFHVARTDCRRWRAAAASLGETYAGHLLRQTVVRRQCRSLETDRHSEAWDWPWLSLHEGHVLPPRLHAAQGAWEIRCGTAGARRRCALLNRLPMPLDVAPGASGDAIVTHFVIDTIAGRETLLWRVFVPAAPSATPVSSEDVAAGLSPEAARRRRGEVRYRLEDTEHAEFFPACAAAGCLMEATVRHAGLAATHLWEGHPLDVRITLAAGVVMPVTLPVAGFRAGLKELMRLRRDEIRSSND